MLLNALSEDQICELLDLNPTTVKNSVDGLAEKFRLERPPSGLLRGTITFPVELSVGTDLGEFTHKEAIETAVKNQLRKDGRINPNSVIVSIRRGGMHEAIVTKIDVLLDLSR